LIKWLLKSSNTTQKDITQLQKGDYVTSVNMGSSYNNVDPKQAWAGYDDFDLNVNFESADNSALKYTIEFSHTNSNDYSNATDLIDIYSTSGDLYEKILYGNGTWEVPSFKVIDITDDWAYGLKFENASYTDGTQGFAGFTTGICQVCYDGAYGFDGYGKKTYKDITQLQKGDWIDGVIMGNLYQHIDPKQAWAGYDDFDLIVVFDGDSDDCAEQWVLEFSHANNDVYQTSATDMITFTSVENYITPQLIYDNGQWWDSYFGVDQITGGWSHKMMFEKAEYTDGTQGFGCFTYGLCNTEVCR